MRLSAVFQEDRLCYDLDPSANTRLVSPSLRQRETGEALTVVGLADRMLCHAAILRALLAEYALLFLAQPMEPDVQWTLR